MPDHSEKLLMHLLMHIGKLLRGRVSSALNAGGIHFGQARILVALLHHDQLTQGAIGRGLHIKPPTVTNLVKKLEASRLIDRQRDENDDRIINVTLTSKGREAADFAVSVMAQIENEIRSELKPEEIDKMLPPLVKIRNVLGGSDPSL